MMPDMELVLSHDHHDPAQIARQCHISNCGTPWCSLDPLSAIIIELTVCALEREFKNCWSVEMLAVCPLLGVKQPDSSYIHILKIENIWREKKYMDKGRAFICVWVHDVHGTQQCSGRYQCFVIQGSHNFKQTTTTKIHCCHAVFHLQTNKNQANPSILIYYFYSLSSCLFACFLVWQCICCLVACLVLFEIILYVIFWTLTEQRN